MELTMKREDLRNVQKGKRRWEWSRQGKTGREKPEGSIGLRLGVT